jgi:hypothetical protein
MICMVSRPLSLAAVAIALAAPGVSVTGQQGQPVPLQYRWTQGEVLRYRTVLLTTRTISGVPGQAPVTLEQSMAQTIKIVVEAVAPEGLATLRQTIESVRMELTTPGGRTLYDSASRTKPEDQAAETMAKVFGAVVGESISIIMAPTGAIRRIDGSSTLVAKVSNGVPRQDPGAAAMADSLKSMLSEPAMRATLEQSFSRLPDRAVSVGDRWTAQLSLGDERIGKITGTSAFTLQSMQGTPESPVAHIAVALTVTQESAPPIGAAGMIMKLGDSHGEGEILFDVAKGRIQRSTMRADMPSTMSVTAPDGTPTTMKNQTKTSTTMELIEK